MILVPLAPQALASFPDADEASRWAGQELSKAEYLAAQPTAFDRASLAVVRFFEQLLNPELGEGNGAVIVLAVLGVILSAGLVLGVLLWGRPRASRRARAAEPLLGERDGLSAHELRQAAERSARSGEWRAAMTQRYRALARGLVERELLDPAPGATAQAIATLVAASHPSERAALLEAAALFDGVRYLGTSGDEHGYLAIRAVDERISASRIAGVA